MKPRWEDAPRWARFLARDGCGIWHWFENEPHPFDGCWHAETGDRMDYAHPVGTEWHESLEKQT